MGDFMTAVAGDPAAVVILAVVCTLLMFAAFRLLRVNYRLASKNELQRCEIQYLQGRVAEARDAFWRYGEIHAAKNTPEGDSKAQANFSLASRMNMALGYTGYLDILERAKQDLKQQPERVPDGENRYVNCHAEGNNGR
jgi:hypothetical protein